VLLCFHTEASSVLKLANNWLATPRLQEGKHQCHFVAYGQEIHNWIDEAARDLFHTPRWYSVLYRKYMYFLFLPPVIVEDLSFTCGWSFDFDLMILWYGVRGLDRRGGMNYAVVPNAWEKKWEVGIVWIGSDVIC